MIDYKRIEEAVEKENIDNWLKEKTDGWKIVNYNEIPGHIPSVIRIQLLLEKIVPAPKEKKRRLFS